MLQRRFAEDGLSARELEFLELIRPAFTDLLDAHEQSLFVGGQATLLGDVRTNELDAGRRLLEALSARLRSSSSSARRSARGVRSSASAASSSTLPKGRALVGAWYGLTNRPSAP